MTGGKYYTYEITDSFLNRIGVISKTDCYFDQLDSDSTIDELKNSGIRKLRYEMLPFDTARDYLKDEEVFIINMKELESTLDELYENMKLE